MSQTNAQAVASKGVQVTAFHKDVFACIQAARKSNETMVARMRALLVSKYGETMPTYEQFKGDRLALAQLADDKGLKDDQWIRKPYNAAVKGLFGDLPKAPGSKVQGVKGGNGSKPGAKKGETAPRTTSERESLEQYITRVGVFKVLQQCALILEADDATKGIAGAIKALKAA
jgi:hypothetical protein